MGILKSYIASLEELELPLVLSDELQDELGRMISPMPEKVLKDYLTEDWESWDDCSELIPLGKISQDQFDLLIFWRIELLSYSFVAYSFSKKEEKIDRKLLAGVSYEGDSKRQMVAVIDEDLIIFQAKAEEDLNNGGLLTTAESKQKNLLVRDSGVIVEL